MPVLIAVGLRVEYKENPEGIDAPAPRLSWVLEPVGGQDEEEQARGLYQTAYRILVLSSRERLEEGEPDLWDSGKVESDRSNQIPYEGKALGSRAECWWQVRVWDQDGVEGKPSEAAFWSMGLLEPQDWRAEWIGFDAPHPIDAGRRRPPHLDDCSWMVLAEGDLPERGPCVPRVYRRVLELPRDSSVELAQFTLSSGGQFTLFVNGQKVGASDGRFWAWHRPCVLDAGAALEPGANVLAIHATHENAPVPPGVIGKLELALAGGIERSIPIDASWKGCEEPEEGWERLDYDDSAWPGLREGAKANAAPWGTLGPPILDLPPCPCLRTGFAVARPVARAVVYATALGTYELRVNGARVGEDRFTPGWTDFDKRVYYNAYDVTDRILQGENVMGVVLGHGWYTGFLGFNVGARRRQRTEPRARVQLEVHYQDGERETIETGPSWRASHGPIVGSDFYMGEQYDARLEMAGWDRPGFDDDGWEPVVLGGPSGVALQSYPGEPVRAIEELKPKRITEIKHGVFIFDLGQNMVGHVRVRVRGERGRKLTLRFGEFLNPDGTLYVENLRGARCIDEFWLKGDGEEVWEPTFTFHGFRYVEVTGYPGTPTQDALTGVVLHSALKRTGTFECSHDMVNQLQHNILWGQKGNFLEVPTDCPQRDERLGWTGDAQVFCRTASYNMETASFFTKWMQDVVDGQHANGAFPDVAPRVVVTGEGSPAWGDAGVIVPWTVYLCYGDTRILERHYDAMCRWVAYLGVDNPGHVRRRHLNNNYGDWLNKDGNTPKELIATAFYAHSARLLGRIAAVLHRNGDAVRYERLFQDIHSAFVRAFVRPDGRIEGDTQTCYVLALHFDLLPENLRGPAARRLVRRIEDAGGHISTGFVGCPYVTQALTDSGHLDVAYALLMNETYPSWGYSIKHGATTVWERWDGWTEHAGFQDPGMNSFNHYAYGAVGDWIYRNTAGIDTDPAAPGYKHIIIRPRLGGGLTHAAGAYESIHGHIESNWRLENGRFRLAVTVPPNTRATVYLPARDAAGVTESGRPAGEACGVAPKDSEPGAAVFEIGSGHYEFAAPIA